MTKAQWKIKSKLGDLYLVASEKGLCGIFFEKQNIPIVKNLRQAGKEIKILAQSARELDEYFCGTRKTFHIPLDAVGTPFQMKVWNQLKKIPYGTTLSYKDVAVKIKNKNAVRAVGTANGRNPLCIVIPCHRVIAANGSLGGYTGGLDKKCKLLDIEQISY